MKRGFTLIEGLVCFAILSLGLAILIPSFNSGCKPVPNSGNAKFMGWVPSVGACVEFNYEGCQYLRLAGGISHKGNCTNTIHGRRLEN